MVFVSRGVVAVVAFKAILACDSSKHFCFKAVSPFREATKSCSTALDLSLTLILSVVL